MIVYGTTIVFCIIILYCYISSPLTGPYAEQTSTASHSMAVIHLQQTEIISTLRMPSLTFLSHLSFFPFKHWNDLHAGTQGGSEVSMETASFFLASQRIS